ncbi:MAG: UDP-N-acetylmuramoyl-tripeptide--D-alanyl-D-alanine ligase [Oscillospiraceae bacterium]|nr:UDP-N-acetylmuramoyl-tripeptide--D-alanyl-D-alanine ligase [Oscillospiraceae bacterium]MDD3832877.1 UDP-N-acetylmuramoyl-tripeptide--D-alanyl-D-alanine ligase [Oscillospiraceae bacterium]MDD4546350.1 UDP-N-acetylmuramoyl-tripeptide--D-alanyl-D-alanine ligase [Oscillospiraceae bacterium]
MPEIISTVVLFAAFVVNCGLLTLHFIHMLQLSSYMNGRYAGWMKENRSEIINQMGWLLLAMVAVACFLLQPTDWKTRTACSILLLLHAYLTRPEKAKKPLVFTNRVKRLLFTHSVLLIIVFAVVMLSGMLRISLGLLFLWGALTPFITLIANAINQPLEKMFARRYVNEARDLLGSMPELTVIGITGSYGKTSAKNFLHTLLSVKYNVLMTPESYNTTMGVVRTIREQLRPVHEIFIAEMGAKKPGDIKEICQLVNPKHGIITSIGEQHLETFKSLDNIINTKFELADWVKNDGILFLNWDNEYIRGRNIDVPRATYGFGNNADYTAHDITVDNGGSSFTVTAPDGETRRFTTELLGRHNIQNVLGCIAVAHKMGISLSELSVPVKRLKPVKHRLQLLPNGYIDDAYNSNPAGFRAALDVLSGFEGQRILVTPGMVELGDRQNELNKELGSYAASRCDYAVLVGEKQAPPLLDGLLSAGFKREDIYIAKTLTDGLNILKELPREGKRTVLLENDLPDNF